MNTLLLLQHKVISILQTRFQAGSSPSSWNPGGQVIPLRPESAVAIEKIAPSPQLARAEAVNDHSPPARPLRVLRVIEQGQGGSVAARLRISGRMADVCAELDRLAAREAALA